MQYENEIIEKFVSKDEYIQNIEYTDCTFRDSDFLESTMKNCRFDNCAFIGCTFRNVKFEFCTMRNCTFTESNLIGVDWSDLQERGSIFPTVSSLKNCVVKANIFVHSQLVASDLSGSTIQYTSFERCDLKKTDFRNVDFKRSAFENCDLRDADFREAHNYQIDTNSNKVRGAKFSYPDVVSLLSPLGIIIED